MPEERYLPTRETLLSRLKNWDDQQSWQQFFDAYWRLIYNVAVKAGLSDAEAQDVVQETILTVARQMPGFKYDGQRGSFKGWLLQTTRWRIHDQFRKRPPVSHAAAPSNNDASTTDGAVATIDTADPAANVENAWDEAWERDLLEAAIDRVKSIAEPKEFQIFDLHVLREWPVKKVADKLRITQAHVYYAKYKVERLVKRELKDLTRESV